MVVGLTSVGVGAASAADSARAGSGTSVVGKSEAGKITSKVVGRTSTGDKVKGKFTPTQVVTSNGVLYMEGFLQGVIKDKGPDTRFSGVQLIPIKKINGSPVTSARAASSVAACDILNLVLGPLDLNVLGLQINLNQVVLDITAVPGAGNLLGNLLCAVAGLLDGTPLAGLLGQLQTLLNQILGLLNLGT
ncbi:hypothetical protein [Nocardioides renjunii]|uniref:hypothetical protein n=1 Tax=Nocardioides renjunii TaxID=3095075 RepID=UPI002AFDFA47|nr:hypothetical protein [Nocardioides sp. S-34]WQQ22522.1 hypothetical protein SHK17_00745 [Nocardioides sp. S-34]